MRRWILLALLIALPCGTAAAEDITVDELLREAGRYLDRPLVWDPYDKRIRGKTTTANLEQIDLEAPLMERVATIQSLLTFYELELAATGPAHYRVYLVYDARKRDDLAAAREALTKIVRAQPGRRVLKILPLEHARPREVARILEHLMIETSLRVSADPRSSRLLLRGLQPDIDQALEVIKALDVVVFEITEKETEKEGG